MPGSRRRFGGLSSFDHVLAVVAHPHDESHALGGLIARLTKFDASVDVLTMSGGTPKPDHAALAEYRKAATLLGARSALVGPRPDDPLEEQPVEQLAGVITDTIVDLGVDALLTFDTNGVTGSADHRKTTEAVLHAARQNDLPVVGWTISARVARSLNQEFQTEFRGRSEFEIDFVVPTSRKKQLRAIAAHRSEAAAAPLVYRRLELSGPIEWTRWLRRPDGKPVVEGWS